MSFFEVISISYEAKPLATLKFSFIVTELVQVYPASSVAECVIYVSMYIYIYISINVTLKPEQLEVCFMSIALHSSIYIYIP